MLLRSHYTSLLLFKMATIILYIMKNKLKLVTLVFIITHCILCGSLKAQQDMSFSDWGKQRQKDAMRKKQQEYDAKFAKQKAQQGASLHERMSQLYDEDYKDMMRKKQQEYDTKFAKQKAQEEQEKAQKMKLREENIQAGLITGGILAIPLIIVSTTLIISRIKENRA